MKKNDALARVMSGEFKGFCVNLPSRETTRSTKNRVREAVFDVLRYDLNGVCFIEVFGGSGVMGFEALSNGAKAAFIIEKDEKAFKIARENARKFREFCARVLENGRVRGADFGFLGGNSSFASGNLGENSSFSSGNFGVNSSFLNKNLGVNSNFANKNLSGNLGENSSFSRGNFGENSSFSRKNLSANSSVNFERKIPKCEVLLGDSFEILPSLMSEIYSLNLAGNSLAHANARADRAVRKNSENLRNLAKSEIQQKSLNLSEIQPNLNKNPQNSAKFKQNLSYKLQNPSEFRRNLDEKLQNSSEFRRNLSENSRDLDKGVGEIFAYFDPPFDIRQGFENIYTRLFDLINSLKSPNLRRLIFEHNSSFQMPENIGNFTLYKAKKFGKTSVAFYENLA